MAQSYVFSLLSILLLFDVYKCRGSGPKSCDESDFPVCATNGSHWYFFKNMCLLNSENHNRENLNLPTLRPTDVSNCFNNCNQRCTNEFSPICAVTENKHKTFQNKCEFDLENCKSGNIWKFVCNGKCDQSLLLNQHPHVAPTQPQRTHLKPFSISQSNTNSNPRNHPHRDFQQQIHPSPITPVPQLDRISFPHIQFNQNPNTHGQHHLQSQIHPHNTQLAHLRPTKSQPFVSIPQQLSHPQNKPQIQNLPTPNLNPKPISHVQPDPHFYSPQHPQQHQSNESLLAHDQPQQQFNSQPHSHPQVPGINENPIQHQNSYPSNPKENPHSHHREQLDNHEQHQQQFEQTNIQPNIQNQPIEKSQPHVRPHHHSQQNQQSPSIQVGSVPDVSSILVPRAQTHPHSHSWQQRQPQIHDLNQSPINPQPQFIPQEKPHAYLHEQPQPFEGAHSSPEAFYNQLHSEPNLQQHLQPKISWQKENKSPQQNFNSQENPQMFQQADLQPQVQSLSIESPTDYSIFQPHVEPHHRDQQYLQSPVHTVTVPEVIKNPIKLQNIQPQLQPQSQSQNFGINENPISQQHVEHHFNPQNIPHPQQFQQTHPQSQMQSLPIENPIDYPISKQHVEPNHIYQQYPPQSPVHPEAFARIIESPIVVPHTQLQPQQHSQPYIRRLDENPVPQQHFQTHSNLREELHPKIFQQTYLKPPMEKPNDYPISQPHTDQRHNSQQYLQSVHPVIFNKLNKSPNEFQHPQSHSQIQSKVSRPFNRKWNNYKTLRQHNPFFHRRRQYLERKLNKIPPSGLGNHRIQQPRIQQRQNFNFNRQPYSQRYPISQPNIQFHPMSHRRPNVPLRSLKHYPKNHHAHLLKYSHPFVLPRSQKLPVPSPQSNVQQTPKKANYQLLPDSQTQSRPHPHSSNEPTSIFFTKNHPQDLQLNKYLIPQPDIQTPSGSVQRGLQIPQVATIPQPRQQPQQQLPFSEQMQQSLVNSNQCPTHCSLQYDPICAIFGDVEHTFDNNCYMKADICGSKRAWVVKHKGECIEPELEVCNANCPRIYSPMCATFNGQNKTFNNECLLDLEICSTGNPWDYLYNGECRKSPRNCPTICPSIYNPVCASYNGIQREFPNQCFVLIEACRTKEDWKIIQQGKCGEETVPQIQPPSEQVIPSLDPISTQQPTPTLLACPICSDSYQPVCGISNGKQQTFNSECLLLSENCYSNAKWTVAHEGECQAIASPDPTSRNCPNFCPLNYEPVCGTFDGIRRTFPNECELNHEAYVTDKQWVIINVGECDYCPVCPNEVSPVCAELGGQTRTFDNTCQVEAENCRTNSAWKIVSKNSCGIRNCPTSCPRVYIPICGISNGEVRTFGNICEMRQEACNTNTVWNIASKGECPSSNENCPKSCSLQYNPVCAVYQGTRKEFINECFLRSENCKTHKNWEFVQAGPCEEQNPHQLSNPASGIPTSMTNPESNNCQINKCLAFRDLVCATFNGEERTFLNTCFLGNVKCKTGEDWKIIKHGSCGETSPSPPRSRILPKHIH